MMGFLSARTREVLPSILLFYSPQITRFPEVDRQSSALTGVMLACSPSLLWLHFAYMVSPL